MELSRPKASPERLLYADATAAKPPSMAVAACPAIRGRALLGVWRGCLRPAKFRHNAPPAYSALCLPAFSKEFTFICWLFKIR